MTKEIYYPENVPLFEAMYGPGLISLGGYDSIDKMFEGIDLKGKSILDVGSGIGGMAYYLAEKYGARVTGLEIHDWMVKYGETNKPEHLKDKVKFISYNADGTIPTNDDDYDIICSKGVLTNIIDKKPVLTEIHRVLKPEEPLCFLDWAVPEDMGPQHITYPSGEVSAKETLSSYRKLLIDAGFKDIQFNDLNQDFLEYVKALQTRLEATDFQNQFDSGLVKILLDSNVNLENTIKAHRQIAVRVLARKTN